MEVRDIKETWRGYTLRWQSRRKVLCKGYKSGVSRSNKININIGDCIYDPPYDNYTVYEASINNDNKYVLKKGLFKSEEELINEIKLQNKAAEFGLSDPIIVAYILENETEYGLIMKKYEQSLFDIFDSEYYDLEDKIKYVDRIKIMLNDLVEKVKICHGDFNLDNIMVDEEDNLKLVDLHVNAYLSNGLLHFTSIVNLPNYTYYYLNGFSEEKPYYFESIYYSTAGDYYINETDEQKEETMTKVENIINKLKELLVWEKLKTLMMKN